MTLLFDRRARVIVQHPEDPDETIEDLRIQFEIEKFYDITLNTARITIFNLAPILRRKLLKRKADLESSPFTTITVVAGYAAKEGTIFKGNLLQGFSTRQGPNWQTQLECVTAWDQYVSAHFKESDSFEDISAFDLLQRFSGQNWLNTASTFEILDFDEITRLRNTKITGYASSGRVLTEVAKLLRKFNLRITSDDLEMFITKENEPLNPTEESISPLMAAETGLLGSPRMTEVGVVARALLNHDLRVGKLFRVRAESTTENDLLGLETQTFTCTRLRHFGDTHADDWETEAEGAWFPLVDLTGTKNEIPDTLPESFEG